MIEADTIKWEESFQVIKIIGREPYLKNREVERAKSFYGEKGYDVIDLDVTEPGMELGPILFAPSSIFTRQQKLIILREANGLKKNQPLKKYCERPMEDNVLILLSRDKGRTAKWFHELPSCVTYEAKEIPEWKVPKWLRDETRSRGYSLSQSLADVIVLNVGTDLFDLDNEIEKIILYKGEEGGKVIRPEDIETVLYASHAPSLFDVVRYWGQGQIETALRYYQSHFERTPEGEWTRSILIILANLMDRVHNLLRARSLREQGVTREEDIAKELGISPWIYRNNVASQVSRRNVKELKTAYKALCEIEKAVKTGGPSGYLLIQRFIGKY